MAHYAFINERNIVTQVIVGRDEDDLVESVTPWQDYCGNHHIQHWRYSGPENMIGTKKTNHGIQ